MKNFSKSKKLVILVLALIVPVLLFNIYKYVEKAKPNEIFEIKNTKWVNSNPANKVISITNHYMLTNPPYNVNELQNVIKKYIEENPVDREDQLNDSRMRVYHLAFYRMSSKLPRNWQPYGGGFAKDGIDNHSDDCIASVSWSDSDNQKTYSFNISKNKNYETIIE